MNAGHETHDCVKRINALLVAQNTVIAEAIAFGNQGREMIQIVTAKADNQKRGRPSTFFASLCPFCGIKLSMGIALIACADESEVQS